MSKFRRVSETEDIPDYIQNCIFPSQNQNILDDPYASLRQEAPYRQMRIERESVGMDRSSNRIRKIKTSKNEWTEANKPTRYSENNKENTPSNTSIANDIRRVQYDVDEAYNMRNMGTNTASIWDPDLERLTQEYVKKGAKEQGMFNSKSAEELREEKRRNWETKNQNSIIKQNKKIMARANPYIAARSHSIIRTGDDFEVASGFEGNFSMHDIIEKENHRLAATQEMREKRLALKRIGKEPDELRKAAHEEWENEALCSIPNMRNEVQENSSFLNSLIDKLS